MIEVERVAPTPRVHIIGDDLGEYLLHPTTRKRFISRSQFLEETRATGGYTVGNDWADTSSVIKQRDSWADKPVSVKAHVEKAERALTFKNDDIG